MIHIMSNYICYGKKKLRFFFVGDKFGEAFCVCMARIR